MRARRPGELSRAVRLGSLDHRTLFEPRPGQADRRGGVSSRGIAREFGAEGSNSGPIAALDPGDMPALLDHVEREAHASGFEELYFSVPMDNNVAVRHLLARGFKIDPFYIKVLADAPVDAARSLDPHRTDVYRVGPRRGANPVCVPVRSRFSGREPARPLPRQPRRSRHRLAPWQWRRAPRPVVP